MRIPTRPGDARAKRELDELYAQLPTIDCKGECHSSCGPIGMTRVELQRIVKKTGSMPGVIVDEDAHDMWCSLLRPDKTCRVYMIRPMVCRLWGLVDALKCPWGCKPEPDYLTYREGQLFLLAAEDIGADEQTLAENQLVREKLLSMSDAEIDLLKGAFTVEPRIQ